MQHLADIEIPKAVAVINENIHNMSRVLSKETMDRSHTALIVVDSQIGAINPTPPDFWRTARSNPA